jgi:probable addiction module antidote protein
VIGFPQEIDGDATSAFLSEAFDSGSKDRILEAIRSVARARGMSSLARETGINRTVLYAALKEGANPTLDTFLAVIEGLELKLRAEATATFQIRPRRRDLS